MNDYKQVDQIVKEVINSGASKASVVVAAANAMVGWPYVWGAVGGKFCTVANRKAYLNSKNIGEGDKNLIKKRCPILSGKQTVCHGCEYYPNDIGTRIADCQGFIKWLFQYVGISFTGGGCTSMWKNAGNWDQQGTIDTMPKDKVCCVFRDVNGTKEHILLYDGDGNYIHDSGEVKKQKISSYKATHWAIPKGLYSGSSIIPPTDTTVKLPTLKKGSRGQYVTLLQTLLLNRGYKLPKYGADGSFGDETVTAVKQFQQDWGLTVDGVVGEKTWRMLESSPERQPLYTVTIPHLTKEQAEEVLKPYTGTMVLEK